MTDLGFTRGGNGLLYTPAGFPVTCDGCSKHLGDIDEATMVHPVRRPEIWAEPGVRFIVCPPLPDGAQPCLDLAILDESLDIPVGPFCDCGACKMLRARR